MQTAQHWKEIFKLLMDEVSIILMVLDARNPLGTFNRGVERFLKENNCDIEIVLVINKIDMIPSDVLDAWYKYFRRLGYRVFSTTAKYDGGVIKLAKFLKHLPASRINNVLIVGYPNTGKSSLIESLSKHKKKIGVSSKAGFTRGIMKVRLNPHVFLIDTPGVIPFDEDDEIDMALKSCIMADKIEDPYLVVEAIYSLVPREQFAKVYGISLDENDDVNTIIKKVGKKLGILRKGGLVNEMEVCKKIIRDWQSNRFKYYMLPPDYTDEDDKISGDKISSNSQSPDSDLKKTDEDSKSAGKSAGKTPNRDWKKSGMIPPSLGIKRKRTGKNE